MQVEFCSGQLVIVLVGHLCFKRFHTQSVSLYTHTHTHTHTHVFTALYPNYTGEPVPER